MIEVEKKFSLENIDLDKFLGDLDFLGEVLNHDIYYDYPDYRLLKNKIYLRNRNGNFELKIKQGSGVYQEIEDENKIADYFKVSSLKDFVNKDLHGCMDIKNNRKKYKKEDFHIDIDDMDFGYKEGEIELLVETEEEIKNAEERIYEFFKKYNLEKLHEDTSKKRVYLKTKRPDLYKIFYEK
ncbi:MAG: CYTH domain-containing protein [Candidatus Pacebacteria bacterium]|nr:CYTH domain-containing protein [Candidatus Paceibacterota bacterium]